MQTLKGNSVCNGIACGKIFFINKSSERFYNIMDDFHLILRKIFSSLTRN